MIMLKVNYYFVNYKKDKKGSSKHTNKKLNGKKCESFLKYFTINQGN